jgi:hypothetical protein
MIRKIAAACLLVSGAVLLGPPSWAQQRTEIPTGYDGIEFDMSIETLKVKRRIAPVHMQGEQENGFEFYSDVGSKTFLGEDIKGWYSVYDGIVKKMEFSTAGRTSSIENCFNALDRWVQPFAKKYGLFNSPELNWISGGYARVEAERKYSDRRVVIYAMYAPGFGCQKGIDYHISFVWNGRRLD